MTQAPLPEHGPKDRHFGGISQILAAGAAALGRRGHLERIRSAGYRGPLAAAGATALSAFTPDLLSRIVDEEEKRLHRGGRGIVLSVRSIARA
jgi:hypothetical protein